MPENATNQDDLDQRVMNYLTEYGRSTCLAISADLDLNPYDALNTLDRLREQGKINCRELPAQTFRIFPQQP